MCDAGVQHQRAAVPPHRAGCADVRLGGLPEEAGGRRGEDLSGPGNVKLESGLTGFMFRFCSHSKPFVALHHWEEKPADHWSTWSSKIQDVPFYRLWKHY